MTYGKSESNYKRNAKNAKKADLILEIDNEISGKIDAVSESIRASSAKIDGALAKLDKTRQDGMYSARQISEIYNSLHEEYQSLRRELKYLAAQNESVFSELSAAIANISAQLSGGTPRYVQNGYYYQPPQQYQPAPPAEVEIDYDKLAEKVAGLLPAQEYISPDYIASKVAEQIVIPDVVRAEQVAAEPAAAAQVIPAAVPVDLQLDEEELADRIALKVRAIRAEDFDIIVDEDGCDSLSSAIVGKLDYEAISGSIAEKLNKSLEEGSEPDYDEIAARIGERVNVTGISEEAVAEKAAQAITESMPALDVDEIADKVVNQLIGNIPAAELDSEEICRNISDKLIESQENHDYDIVIDEEGLGKITEYVSDEVKKSTDARFDEVEKKIEELKSIIGGGQSFVAVADLPAEEQLVTVSEVVSEGREEVQDETSDESAVMAEIVNDIDEVPAQGEYMPDGLGEATGGVDFEHMMKYNRSFIARIIQSTDEQKEYYGRVKTALLSYAKVNSSLAWGAERFNKGRETIARFKIRGKTLCLYLALDPKEFPYSVYHHADVSDNKSMHGTPLMVKIKSPRGVKKAIRLIDEMLTRMGAVKRTKFTERDYAAMYPYESMEELIEDGLVKDVGN